MNLVAGIVVADRFRRERPLGQGGMGAVWLAQHMGLDVPCAVKLIHAESAASPEIRARFEREAKSAAQLRSPNVVQILDHGIREGAPSIAMEYLEGEDLAARLRTRGRFDPRETAAIASQVARPLRRQRHRVGHRLRRHVPQVRLDQRLSDELRLYEQQLLSAHVRSVATLTRALGACGDDVVHRPQPHASAALQLRARSSSRRQ